MKVNRIDNEIDRLYKLINDLKTVRQMIVSKCDHEWGTDGIHSNEYCKKCFMSKPNLSDETYYKLLKRKEM